MKATLIQYICMKLKQVVRDNLRRYMADRGIGQAELARRCNMSQSAMSRFLSEDRAPNIDTIEKISAALRVAPFMLLMPPGEDVQGDMLTLWDAMLDDLPPSERQSVITDARVRKILLTHPEYASSKKSRA